MSIEEPRWLSPLERSAWLPLLEVSMRLPAELDSRLLREAGITLFEYHVLAMLSEEEGRVLPMSDLAQRSYASLSRLSHVVKKLQARDYVTRARAERDARVTVVELTDQGLALVQRLAPEHVGDVRDLVFDALDERDVADLARLGRKLVAWTNPDHWSLRDAAVRAVEKNEDSDGADSV